MNKLVLDDVCYLKGKTIGLNYVNGDYDICNVISVEDNMIMVEYEGIRTLIPFSSILRMNILNLNFGNNRE